MNAKSFVYGIKHRSRVKRIVFQFEMFFFIPEVCQDLPGLIGLLWCGGWLYSEVSERDFCRLWALLGVFLFWGQYIKIILYIFFLKYSDKL